MRTNLTAIIHSTVAAMLLCCACGWARSMPIMLATPDCGDSCVIGMHYYGGPVMTNPIDVFSIWYGDWGRDPAQTILPTVFRSLTGSDYLNIPSLYTHAQGTTATNRVHFRGALEH